MKFEKLIPDLSVIRDGVISQKIEKKEFEAKQILVHEGIVNLLESEAQEGKASGFLGLTELKKLQEFASSEKFELNIVTTKNYNIRFLKEEINNLICTLAWNEGGTLLTNDNILAKTAQARGIDLVIIPKDKEYKKIKLENFFDTKTMSVHLREGVKPMAKKGTPGAWDFVAVKEKKLTAAEIKDISTEIIEAAHLRTDGFIEIEREGSTIIQLGLFRIVILRPPLSDGWEITAVRPVKRLNLDDYKLSEKLLQRIEEQAEGILISGAPGHGKTTFAQALAVFYAKQGKIVKTVEAPRDLVLPEEITQLAISKGTQEEIHDILLLSRPDYTMFDEMRNTQDFILFADLRLAGVGMVGVVHGTNPVDSIQRFIGRIELGVIPHVLDTVIFIKNGQVSSVLAVEMKVKVPAGMTEADLARPVVVISDFETGKPYAEMYTYGEETVVVPVTETQKATGMHALAAKQIEEEFLRYSDHVVVEPLSEEKVIVRVPERYISAIIGKEGKNISRIEERLGIRIDVRSLDEEYSSKPTGKKANYKIKESSKTISFDIGTKYFGNDVDIYANNEFIATFAVGKKGVIKVKKTSALGRLLLTTLREGEKIELRVK